MTSTDIRIARFFSVFVACVTFAFSARSGAAGSPATSQTEALSASPHLPPLGLRLRDIKPALHRFIGLLQAHSRSSGRRNLDCGDGECVVKARRCVTGWLEADGHVGGIGWCNIGEMIDKAKNQN